MIPSKWQVCRVLYTNAAYCTATNYIVIRQVNMKEYPEKQVLIFNMQHLADSS